MKRILLTIVIAISSTMLIMAQTNKVKESDSIQQSGKTQLISQNYTPTYSDTDDTGTTVESIDIDVDSTDISDYVTTQTRYIHKYTTDVDFLEDFFPRFGGLIAVLTILIVFGFPIIIVLLVLFFRYKNRRNRYRLMEKALATGQQIPSEVIKETVHGDLKDKGIKNICLGIGLFIFLWAITNFAIGCIGIIVLCNGIGQYIIANRKNKENNEDQ